MIARKTLPLCLAIGAAQVSAATISNEFSCRSEGSDAVISDRIPASVEIRIEGRHDICSGGFEIIARPGDVNKYLLTTPIELGLRANMQVFALDASTASASAIGELPVSADYIGNLRFIDTFQQGGSIFQSRYEIGATGVSRSPLTLELAFEGLICVRSARGAYRQDISTMQGCMKVLQATRRKPICLFHINNRATAVNKAKCRHLRQALHK